jgi:beta-glucanase (GH16 family)
MPTIEHLRQFSRDRRTLLSLGSVLLVVACFSMFLAIRDQGTGRTPQPPTDGPLRPFGPGGDWNLAFGDEFDGASLDAAKWTDRSSAEADEGRGNKNNKQLEWNQAANCAVAGGALTMTAKRESVTSTTGIGYDWTSCLLASTYSFQYGFIEERAVLPAPKGFWPAFWTWQANGVNVPVETDVYEFHSDNHGLLELTQHSGSRGGCKWAPKFDPSEELHVYGAAIEPSGTTWYVDGQQVCRTGSTSNGVTNIITNLAVFAESPPADSTGSATKRVDYIRAWQRR